jgi:putative modified peptide
MIMAFQFSHKTINKLLDKLSTDDNFRALFQKSPREALASVGHKASLESNDSASGVWACCQTNQLASKEAIAASRDALRTQLLTQSARMSPITLEAASRPGKPRK